MSFIEKLKSEFPTQTAFQIALYTYVYNKDYKKDLKLLRKIAEDGPDSSVFEI